MRSRILYSKVPSTVIFREEIIASGHILCRYLLESVVALELDKVSIYSFCVCSVPGNAFDFVLLFQCLSTT